MVLGPFMLTALITFRCRFGTYSVTEAINASLDLEMPGVTKWRTHDKVKRSIQAHKVTLRTVKERASKVIKFAKKLSATNQSVSRTTDRKLPSNAP